MVALPWSYVPNNNLWNYITPGDWNYYAQGAVAYKVNNLRIRLHNSFPLYDYTAGAGLQLQGQGSPGLKILEPSQLIQNQRYDDDETTAGIAFNPNPRHNLLFGDTDNADRS